MKLNVENFGKIKSASVNLDGYSIFVGDNNSGKTYLMQLIYGVFDAVRNMFEIDMIPSFHIPTNENPMEINSDNVQDVLNLINAWLDRKKNKIVKATFNFDIDVGKIWLTCAKKIPSILIKPAVKDESGWGSDEEFSCYDIFIDNKKGGGFAISKDLGPGMTESDQINSLLCGYVFNILVYGDNYYTECLYLPACRSGLNLLYKDVVGAYASKFVSHMSFMDFRDRKSVNPGEKLGLTKPIFDYMLFLQRYKKDLETEHQCKALISFINENILHGGRIDRDEDGEIRYFIEKEKALPLHVSSSMVNEISPIILFLTSIDRIKNIFYDEIETSQHPKTQLQLARLLNRLVNAGFKMVVSTHSDTMAAAISNLVALSFAKDKEKKCKMLGYENDDLLRKDVVHAYQFIKDDEGRSIVTEIEKFNELGMGYDFSLFSEVSNKIFNDAKTIYGEDDVGSKC